MNTHVCQIATARVGYKGREGAYVIDTTVKSAKGIARTFAPTWPMAARRNAISFPRTNRHLNWLRDTSTVFQQSLEQGDVNEAWATGGQPTCEPIARSEGILDKPTFRDAFARTRCLIPADGFYLWSDEKKPSFVHFRDRRLFAIAGVFSVNRHFPATPASFAGLTTFPNMLVAERHHRMPVILKPEDEPAYLDPDTPIEDIQALLLPLDEKDMEMYEVSPRLTRAEDNSSDFVRPLAELKLASSQPKWVRETGQRSMLD